MTLPLARAVPAEGRPLAVPSLQRRRRIETRSHVNS